MPTTEDMAQLDFNKIARAQQLKLYPLLGRGKENVRTSKQLGQTLDIIPEQIKALANQERKYVPIASSNAGYWIPANQKELRDTISRMQSQYETLRDTIDSQIKFLPYIPGIRPDHEG